MGYQIIYGTDKTLKPQGFSTVRIRILTALCFAIFAITVRLLWPEGREMMASVLLPGDLSITQVAFNELQENLRQGMNMADSISVFCREILHEIA